MSKAYKCDGCGRMVSGKPRKKLKTLRETTNILNGTETYTSWYDLCDGCYMDLNTNFLDGGDE